MDNPTTLHYRSKEKFQFIPLHTKDVNINDFQALSEEPSVNQEKDERKDAVYFEENLIKSDFDLTKKIEIVVRPHKQAMDALIANLKKSYITYPLSSLIQLFLDKKERFDILITSLQPDVLFCTQKENLPFLSKENALNYLIKKHWFDVFEKQTILLSPIQGHFTSINRCGITNILLGPPNYHLYNDLTKEHYKQNLSQNYSWVFFVRQIKNERDPSLIEQWKKESSEHAIFKLKSDKSVCFDSFISAKNYLQHHLGCIKDTVKACNSFSLSYAEIDRIKDPVLKQQIYQKINDEFRSPISLGCFCRTRFRNAGLHIYKKRKGSSCISLLCSIKRKIRNENDRELSDELTRILDYIEIHPMIDLQACIDNFCSDLMQTEGRLKINKAIILLIKAGYITQFENGKLYVSPKQKCSTQKATALKIANE